MFPEFIHETILMQHAHSLMVNSNNKTSTSVEKGKAIKINFTHCAFLTNQNIH